MAGTEADCIPDEIKINQREASVVVHAGVYRECVVPRRGGTGPDSMIAYEAAPGEEVIVSGAEPWTPRCLPSTDWHTGIKREDRREDREERLLRPGRRFGPGEPAGRLCGGGARCPRSRA